jgi:hypothetical protein
LNRLKKMATNGNNKYTAAQMIDAIQAAEGNLTEAARIIGCSRTTIYNYMEKYVTVKQTYEEVNEKTIDWVEDKLLDQCRRGNMTAIIFFLKTKAKHRGYVERQEFTGKEGKDLIPENIVRIITHDGDSS